MKFVNLWGELTIGGNRIKIWLAGEGGATGEIFPDVGDQQI